jgi:DNA (cytosine-5)-methyltransferase 1
VSLSAVDLFCGAGGLTVGLRRAGFAVLGAIDIEPVAIRAYRLNHSETTVWEGDISRLDPAEMRRLLGLRPGELDLLAGCPPCQGFSNMRTLNGSQRVADSRNRLVMQIARYAAEFRPRAVMLENVPGLAADWRSSRLRGALRKLGYRVCDATLDTAAFGVPQHRRRYVLVAQRTGAPRLATADSQVTTVRDAIGALPTAGASGDRLHDHGEHRGSKVRKLIAAVPHNGGSRGDLDDTWQLPCHKRTDGFHDVYGRMSWDDTAPTITGGCINPSKGRFLHPSADRAITLREAALLQTFPVDYKLPLNEMAGCGKYAMAELIGNALPPEFVYRQARSIARDLRGQGSRRPTKRRSSPRVSAGALYQVAA